MGSVHIHDLLLDESLLWLRGQARHLCKELVQVSHLLLEGADGCGRLVDNGDCLSRVLIQHLVYHDSLNGLHQLINHAD